MDERPISQRLKRRDGSKPPPSYSGHDGDEESSDEDVGGESVEGSEAGQAGGAQAASSSNTNPPRQTFSCSICARDFGTAKSLCTHVQDAQLHARGPRLQWAHQVRVLRSDLLPHPQQTSRWLGYQRDEHVLQPPLVSQRRAAPGPQAEDHAIAKALQQAAPGTPGANLTHADNRGVSAATRARRLAWAPAVPGAAACSAAAVAALRNATGVSLA